MEMTATVFKCLSYLALASGVFLVFWDMSASAVAFLCSIAFAHLSSVLRNDKHMADMEETLGILRTLAAQSKEKCDAVTGPGDPPRAS